MSRQQKNMQRADIHNRKLQSGIQRKLYDLFVKTFRQTNKKRKYGVSLWAISKLMTVGLRYKSECVKPNIE